MLFIWEQAIEKTGGYFYSRLLLAVINGTGMYITLRVFSVPFAAPLAIFEGLVAEFIPIVGTYIAGAAPVFVALLSSPAAGIAALAYVLIYQQIENYFLSPRLTAKTMALHPALAFAAALIGGSLGGILTAFLALPVAGVIQAAIVEYGKRYAVVEVGPDGRARSAAAQGRGARSMRTDARPVQTRRHGRPVRGRVSQTPLRARPADARAGSPSSAQLLSAPRPRIDRGGRARSREVQMDPTRAVARTEHLVLWSRLGKRFRIARAGAHALGRALAVRIPGAHRAHVDDYALHRESMRRFAGGRTPSDTRRVVLARLDGGERGVPPVRAARAPPSWSAADEGPGGSRPSRAGGPGLERRREEHRR